jgi:hypothetical protein
MERGTIDRLPAGVIGLVLPFTDCRGSYIRLCVSEAFLVLDGSKYPLDLSRCLVLQRLSAICLGEVASLHSNHYCGRFLGEETPKSINENAWMQNPSVFSAKRYFIRLYRFPNHMSKNVQS